MSGDQPVSEFLASFKAFMDHAVAQAPPPKDPIFRRRLQAHFGADPATLPIVSERFAGSEHPNIHLALNDYIHAAGRSAELLGLIAPHEHTGVKLAALTQPSGSEWSRPRAGPVEYVNIALDDDRVLACVQLGLYLVQDGDVRLAVLLQGPLANGWQPGITIEVMAHERATGEAFLSALRAATRQRNVYRGHVISLDPGRDGPRVQFHRLPAVARDDIILPQGVLDRIERQTVRFARLGPQLRAAGRHLKRGLLLYGPPGTGKTLTAMYLAAQMPERTVILLTGQGVGMIEESCAMARLLQPATLILEDVDLIAEERTRQSTGANALLFELLNQMDGLADDADILFLLTTNRPEILEPALAARPGRIDQAIEVPLPDDACRRRLFALYSDGLTVRLTRLEQFIEQTEGVSAAFIRELMRKAALYAADEGAELVVEDRHVSEALHELVVEGGELTKRLLGAGSGFGAGQRRADCG